MRKLMTLITVASMLIAAGVSAEPSYRPKEGYVPNRDVAEKIAEAVLVPIYGKQVLGQKPFKISLNGDRWVVEGHLKSGPNNIIAGGVAYIEIKKDSGEILKVIHGK